ncbi:pepsin/retropepsin-like aspartic protease family protein [Urbifossiella limnaea]|uniref:Peptidase A2 domain-containing protein n=1 Tax=Urbifossiella limnaea TaxID=2528023 RepID=A0A517Y092_9BACT|nr:hypothetical protein [Urbifossiella limnaea]QDU23173.1 hypothetical protein ETAA1_51650 [Urbifossiella limnaea]
MPGVSGSWNEADGAALRVWIGLSAKEVRRLRAAGSPIPQPIDVLALVDTGAQVTCVDPDVLARLPLDHYGFTHINVPAAGGLGYAVQYAASLTIPHPSGRVADNFHKADLPLTEVPLGPFGCDILIGRDLLVLCAFRLDGPSLTFTLDY